jgi:hypothetical protein
MSTIALARVASSERRLHAERLIGASAMREAQALRCQVFSAKLKGSDVMARLRLYWRSVLLLLWLACSLVLAASLRLAEFARRRPLPGLRQRLSRDCLRLLRACLPVQVQVRGELPSQTTLWVCNHVPWVDIALLGALHPLTFLSKAEVCHWPIASRHPVYPARRR